MTARYVTPALLEQLADQLGDRDRAIAADLARVRVLTGAQLERLHFGDLSPVSRGRTRRRVLARLVALGIVATLTRRIGGARAGSAGLVYALDLAGQRLLPLLTGEMDETTRTRRPWTPGHMFLTHTLAVSEIYVRLVEKQRTGALVLDRYVVEPAAWQPNGMSGFIKPDAYLVLRASTTVDAWWIEVDRATESLVTLRHKLLAYVDFANAGQLGPDGVMPFVLVTVPHTQRLTAVRELIENLPEPNTRLVSVALEDHAITRLIEVLNSDQYVVNSTVPLPEQPDYT